MSCDVIFSVLALLDEAVSIRHAVKCLVILYEKENDVMLNLMECCLYQLDCYSLRF